jgi:EAL and modified HD-GYP domain-containing signal transduction protein
MLLAGAHEGPDQQLKSVLTRARMSELTAEGLGAHLADQGYTVGLLSALEPLLGTPLTEIVAGLSLTAELEEALCDHTGVLGRVLADVVAWEGCYLEASEWAAETSLVPQAAW